MDQSKRIAYACESFGHRPQLGAIRAGASHGIHVRCFLTKRERFERMLSWNPDGVIIDIADVAKSTYLHKICGIRGIPVVDMTWDQLCKPKVPSVAFNSLKIGELAAQYFLELGLNDFAFVGSRSLLYSQLRLQGFQDYLKKSGQSVEVFQDQDIFQESADPPDYVDAREVDFVYWLSNLAPGTGLFCANDRQAFVTADIAHHHKLNIEERCLLLGADNDRFFCEAMSPTLSSVPVPFEELGAEAIQLFTEIFDGRLQQPELRVLDPLPVISRVSTQLRFSEDPVLARALAYIDQHLMGDCRISDIAQHVGVSLPCLHGKFNKYRGHTPLQEIHERRFKTVERLLRESQRSIEEISVLCGFKRSSQFSTVFRARYHETPSAYRKRFRKKSLSLRD
ncbi:substrate-binding domain-containing protein [Coraliomargarita sp. W4R53]